MINNVNPWINMPESSQRRVESDTQYNLFWITDMQGNYGFCLQINELLKNIDDSIKLKGISVLKRNSSQNYGELFLILNKKEDWEIFHTLCADLIATTHRCDTDEKMICAVEIRLKRWQQLLKQDRNEKLTLEIQMGLFSELVCLKDILAPKIGIRQAIISWVGPEFDKQDFLMDNAIIEVKSYRTSKGEIVHISSLQQLYSPKDPLYLLSNGLTCSENGQSIEDISMEIKELLKQESNEILYVFEKKLIGYGYIPEVVKEPLQKFVIDSQKLFYISDSFPKIVRKDIKNQIIDVKYSIDLTQCCEYEVGINSLLI